MSVHQLRVDDVKVETPNKDDWYFSLCHQSDCILPSFDRSPHAAGAILRRVDANAKWLAKRLPGVFFRVRGSGAAPGTKTTAIHYLTASELCRYCPEVEHRVPVAPAANVSAAPAANVSANTALLLTFSVRYMTPSALQSGFVLIPQLPERCVTAGASPCDGKAACGERVHPRAVVAATFDRCADLTAMCFPREQTSTLVASSSSSSSSFSPFSLIEDSAATAAVS